LQRGLALGDLGEQLVDPRHDPTLLRQWWYRQVDLLELPARDPLTCRAARVTQHKTPSLG
jgi:hypothetical protein